MENYWKEISKIHLLTKHYMILTEEIDEQVFLQPMKEHRDAYDHIIRIYGLEFSNKKDINDINQYKISNMRKALGHEYRAFFDTADWLSLVCREKIRTLLQGLTPQEIMEKLPEYPEIKMKLLYIPERIAELRQEKDIGNNLGIIEEVEQYRVVLDELLEFYHRIYEVFK